MRYIPLTEEEKGKILKEIGVSSFEELICAIPEEIRVKNDLNLPQAVCEEELLEKVYNIAKKNANFFEMKPLVGAGAYRHYVPEVVKSVMARSEFYTAYTPYQPEVSQGTLQTMFEVQTHLSRLTGMDVVVPSLYDGASATAEAVLMAMRLTHKNKIMLGALLHPHYKETIKTYTAPHDVEIMEIPFENYLTDINELERNLDDNVACVIIQNPNFLGGIERMKAISDVVHKKQALMIETVTESLSLAILTSGRENGIDMFTGEAQSFGMELNFGGPYNGFLATKNEFIRQLQGVLQERLWISKEKGHL
jgi:glycine dehydrogenase subunit 1